MMFNSVTNCSKPSLRPWSCLLSLIVFLLCFIKTFQDCAYAQKPAIGQSQLDDLARQYSTRFVPLLNKYCAECHSQQSAEADIDLTQFTELAQVRQALPEWQRVYSTLSSQQMPPQDAPQLPDEDRQAIVLMLNQLLSWEAQRLQGDPGPILLRRLSNTEYTNSIRALTGIDTLNPAREFPTDGASGEGFTNAANALMMSPSLLTKYLDAAKEISQHLVLLPDGIRFSQSDSRRDWTEESLAEIRKIYGQYSAADGASQVNLQGIVFATNDGGRLPLDAYLRATIDERDRLRSGTTTIATVAKERELSPKYLQHLWQALTAPSGQLLQQLGAAWEKSSASDVPTLVAQIQAWQNALWKFNSVGHIGKVNGPTSWMQAINPIAKQQEFRVPMPPLSADAADVTLYLVAGDAGDGNQSDEVVWHQPRLVASGRPDIRLKELRRIATQLQLKNHELLACATQALAAADRLIQSPDPSVQELAVEFQIEPDLLSGWLEYLGIQAGANVKITGHLDKTVQSLAGYDFVRGWAGDNALSILANASEEHVRVPGNMKPRSVAVHPAPNVQMVIGWSSPIQGLLQLSGFVKHAHPECGNGVVWSLQLRRGATVQSLAGGVAHGDQERPIELAHPVFVSAGDLLCLVIGPRDGNHACDLTQVQLRLEQVDVTQNVAGKATLSWDLSAELSNDLLAGNPHADALGNPAVWHFFGEPTNGPSGPIIPSDSLLARWQASGTTEQRRDIADSLAQLLAKSADQLSVVPAADQQLYHQLRSLGGPLMAASLRRMMQAPVDSSSSQEVALDDSTNQLATFGLPSELFGKRLDGQAGDADSLYVQSPSVIPLRLPASLVAGAELVMMGRLADQDSLGSVQLSISQQPPESTGLVASSTREISNAGAWTASGTDALSLQPVIISAEQTTGKRFEHSFEQFRQIFPAALCYSKIVPVDEVVTLTLYYREDEALQRLMLDQAQIEQLNRCWEQLHYVSRDALALVDAYEQLWQYATQDADPAAFEPLREPIMQRAALFKRHLVETEPKQVEAIVKLANQAFRRPLTSNQRTEIMNLYSSLRQAGTSHEAAMESLVARLLISPAFLYRQETGQGAVQSLADGEVPYRQLDDHELATRLSYFLSSAPPDARLRQLADDQSLRQPQILLAEVDRLLDSRSVRHLATEFGCQWLHIYDFAEHDEKSDQFFPSFKALRSSMYEESIRFWVDMFQQDRSMMHLLNSDQVFVDRPLAEHYGINLDQPGIAVANQLPDDWLVIADANRYGRGGILTMASVLSKQSGASRTSPILRGNWISEVLLGEKLPKPPAGVPVLPETAPAGLTERQLIEMHSNQPACAKCHLKIDPLGFAMEGYDAIGRRREDEMADTRTTLSDGTEIADHKALRDYLVQHRRDAFISQFCKKLLGYSLGRSVQFSDQRLLEQMHESLRGNDYHVRQAIRTIVTSPQFLTVRVDGVSSDSN